MFFPTKNSNNNGNGYSCGSMLILISCVHDSSVKQKISNFKEEEEEKLEASFSQAPNSLSHMQTSKFFLLSLRFLPLLNPSKSSKNPRKMKHLVNQSERVSEREAKHSSNDGLSSSRFFLLHFISCYTNVVIELWEE